MPTTLDDILNSARTGRAIVMGVLNVTPDSFSDGGAFFMSHHALDHARRMIEEGADALDIGAESTRPGSARVSADDQIARLRDVLPAVCRLDIPVSIDTTLAPVAAFALNAGAVLVNDVSAGRDDPALLPLVVQHAAGVCLMHMHGEPKTMQHAPKYADVVAEVVRFLSERLDAAFAAGVPRHRCILDPGIGFGKRLEHNLALLAGVGKLAALGRPVLIGASRKRFLGDLSGVSDPAARVPGTIAACLAARRRGATIFRVHDVSAVVQALKVADAIERA